MHRRNMAAVLVAVLGFFTANAAAQVGSATVQVKGMSCPFCAFGVEKRLGAVPGVKTVIVSMKGGRAELAAEEGRSIDLTAVPEAVRRAGFTPGNMVATVRGTLRATDGGFELVPGGEDRPLSVEPAGPSMSATLARAAREGGLWDVTGEVELTAKTGLRLRITAIGPRS